MKGNKLWTVLDASLYDKEGLCPGIELRKHIAGELEEVGAFRAQEDWRRLVGPLPRPYAGLLGPDFSFVTISVPECLPERMEIVAYALEFGFIHDDVIDTDVNSASLDEVRNALHQGQGGKIENRGSDGKRQIVTQIIREMMAIDPAGAMNVAKSWSSGVGHSDRRKEDTDFKTLEEYIPYRALDVGYMLWHGLVCFGCAITIPEEEEEEARRLIMPALVQASLLNDIFSFEKEKHDANVQNAVLIVMNEHGCGEAKAREILKDRIRLECNKYVANVRETNARTDVSDELKRYIDVMQYTLSGNAAWSPNCPRYNGPTKYNELQMLRGKHGLAKYPSCWSPEHKANGVNGVNGGDACSGNKRKRENVEDDGLHVGKNGTNGVKTKKPALAKFIPSSTPPEDVMQLARDSHLPDLSESVMVQPYRYLTSLPSKGFREKAIESINKWLRVPAKSVDLIQEVVRMLHNASLMLDDIEDNSPLRRGRPSTHNIYGVPQTINSATYQYIAATDLASRLPNPESFRIFLHEARQLHVGQSYDLYWTHNTLCPSVADYLKMVDMKTGGLFRMLTRMMAAESPVGVGGELPNGVMDPFSCLFGRYFQIRDDYQNLASADYAKAKGFAEDLDEGKYSFSLIHCIQTLEAEQPRFERELIHLRSLLIKRRVEGKLSHEGKNEVLTIMNKTQSLEYTLGVLRDLHGELMKEVDSLERMLGDNLNLRVMLELLGV